jgi:4-alpha-glucanotransferase
MWRGRAYTSAPVKDGFVKPSSLFRSGRHAGLLLPLFSAGSLESWGIGEILDLPLVCSWLEDCGFGFLQVLPLNEMPADDHSPYSAISAMAIDPIYLSLRGVPDFLALGGEDALSSPARRSLSAVRAARRIDYRAIRSLKMDALSAAFDRFYQTEWAVQSPRARRLGEYRARERWWLAEYALYRALRERHRGKPWWDWEPALARHDASALARARAQLADRCLFHTYVQWLADTQWSEARRTALPVGVFGDIPFMVRKDSADVWAHQHAFRLNASVGAPPDAFSESGQDWELPVYRWDVFAAEDYGWIRERAQRNAALFDGYRIDHLVGFYRTFVVPDDGGARTFVPAMESDQRQLGEQVMAAFLDAGARIIAEDLGIVPDFVRDSLRRLGIAGYKVLRWEREWAAPCQPFRNPEQYPPVSVATTGTHDTDTLVEWWETATLEERTLVAQIPFLASRPINVSEGACDAATRDSLLEAVVASSSDLLIVPIQDVFGWRDRVNVPATVTEDNWTWRLPWPADDLCDQPEARDRAETLSRWMCQYHRSAPRDATRHPSAPVDPIVRLIR